MFGRELELARVAAALAGGYGLSVYNYEDAFHHHNRAMNRVPSADLSKRPTPPLAPEKPMSKRQKRRLRKKK